MLIPRAAFSPMPRLSETPRRAHQLAHPGGIEVVDAAPERDDAFRRRPIEPRRQAVAHLDEMLGFADRRRAPLAARAVAARLEHAPAIEFDAQQHVHLLEGICARSSSPAVMPKWVPNWLGNILIA